MKSILKLFSVLSFGLLVSTNTIACTTKSISSLEAANGYVISAADPKVSDYLSNSYSDITYWSSSTISSDNFKNIFMENLFAKLKNPGTGFNYFDMISDTNGLIDSNDWKITGDNTTLVKLPILLLAEYEVNSTNPKISDLNSAYNQYLNDFNYYFYQDGNNPISTINPVDISTKYNHEKVYKLSFSVAIKVSD